MKSSEIKIGCPICHRMVGRDYINGHIAQMARLEKGSYVQADRKHYHYYLTTKIWKKK